MSVFLFLTCLLAFTPSTALQAASPLGKLQGTTSSFSLSVLSSSSSSRTSVSASASSSSSSHFQSHSASHTDRRIQLGAHFKVLATTTTTTTPAPTLPTVPANPCLEWGCPSTNANCDIGTTGPAGLPAADCIVRFAKVIYNLNLSPAAGTSDLLTAQSAAQLQASVLKLSGGPATWGATVESFQFVNGTGVKFGIGIVVIIVNIVCPSCQTTELDAATVAMTATVSPSNFALTGLPIQSVSTCMAMTAVNSVCGDNLNVVPPPSSASSGAGVNAGAVAGGVIGGLAGLALLAGGVVWYNKRARGAAFNITTDSKAAQPAQSAQSAPPISTTPMQRPAPSSSMGGDHLSLQGAPYAPQHSASHSTSTSHSASLQPSSMAQPSHIGYGQRPPYNTGNAAPAPPPKRTAAPIGSAPPPPLPANSYAAHEVSPSSQAWNQAPQTNYGWSNNRGY